MVVWLLIQAGLFSAAVTAFIIESYKALSQDPSDVTNILLYQISNQLSEMSNGTQLSLPSSLLPARHPFTASRQAVIANILFFISLGLSLACAVSATLVQQWARNYIHAIERRPNAERSARMRMYLFEGIQHFHMADAVDAIPSLLHLALFTFFLGLFFFISPINTILGYTTLATISVSFAVYAFATCVTFFAFNSPIQTPLTNFLWNRSLIQTVYFIHSIMMVLLRPLADVIRFLWASLAITLYGRVRDLCYGPFGLLLCSLSRSIQSASLHRRVFFACSLSSTVDSIGIRRYFRKPFVQYPSLSKEIRDLDAARTSVTRNDEEAQDREEKALFWLALSLDEDRELFSFVEAIPLFLSSAHHSSAAYKTFTSLFRSPNVSFYKRLEHLILTYPDNHRVLAATVDALLLVKGSDWLEIRHSSDPGMTYFTIAMLASYSTSSLPASLRVRSNCLVAIMVSWMLLNPLSNPERDVKDLWRYWFRPQSGQFSQLWHKLLTDLGYDEWGRGQYDQSRTMYLIYGVFILRVLPDISESSGDSTNNALISALSILKTNLGISYLPIPQFPSPAQQHPPKISLSQEELSSYCKTMLCVYSAWDMKATSSPTNQPLLVIHYQLLEMIKVLHYVPVASESLFPYLDQMLQKMPLSFGISNRSGEFNYEIRRVVSSQHRLLGAEKSQFSAAVMAKCAVLTVRDRNLPNDPFPWEEVNFGGLNSEIQRTFVEKTRDFLDFCLAPSTEPIFTSLWIRLRETDPETGTEKMVPLLEDILSGFRTLTDVEALTEAVTVMDIFLQHYSNNQYVVKYRIELISLLSKRPRVEVQTEHRGRPSRGVQADLDEADYDIS